MSCRIVAGNSIAFRFRLLHAAKRNPENAQNQQIVSGRLFHEIPLTSRGFMLFPVEGNIS
jgi:hypothetical protein